jgi:hypothetical protein
LLALLHPCRPHLSYVSPAGRLAAVKAPVVQAYNIAYFHISAFRMALIESMLQRFLADPLLRHLLWPGIVPWPNWRVLVY